MSINTTKKVQANKSTLNIDEVADKKLYLLLLLCVRTSAE